MDRRGIDLRRVDVGGDNQLSAAVMTFADWAARWRLPQQALDELAQLTIHPGQSTEMSESGVQQRVRLEGAKLGFYLWRNNVGAGKLAEGGRFIRFGLANDSPALNKTVKSGDLIGLRSILITPDMVGRRVAQFVSREIKRADWQFSGTLEECAQLQWANLINAQGGDAKIVCGPGSFG